MGPLDLLYHLLNFIAPALAVGLMLAIGTPIFMGNRALARVFIAQTAINTVAGVLALSVGLWFFGRDGKMLSYAAMVLAVATCQWTAMRR
jgi:hypothetical protein